MNILLHLVEKNINTIISFLVNLNTIYAKLSSALYFVSD